VATNTTNKIILPLLQQQSNLHLTLAQNFIRDAFSKIQTSFNSQITTINNSISTLTGSSLVAPVTGSQIANQTITATNIANSTITGSQIVGGVALAGAVSEGKNSTVNSLDVITSKVNPPTNGLVILRGGVSAAGAANAGDGGFSASLGIGNVYSVGYTVNFLSGDKPIVLVMPIFSGVGVSMAIGTSDNTGFNVTFVSGSITCAFFFLSIGQAA
jgi:hypothetical protein